MSKDSYYFDGKRNNVAIKRVLVEQVKDNEMVDTFEIAEDQLVAIRPGELASEPFITSGTGKPLPLRHGDESAVPFVGLGQRGIPFCIKECSFSFPLA